MTTQVERLIAQQRARLDAPERAIAEQIQDALVETFGSLEIDLRVVLQAIEEARNAGTPVDPAWLQQEPRYRRFKTRLLDIHRRFVDRALLTIVQGQRLFARQAIADVAALFSAIGIDAQALIPRSSVGRDIGTPESLLRQLLDGLGEVAATVVETQLDVLPDGAVPPPRPPRSPLLKILTDSRTDARTRTLIRTEVMRSYREATRERHMAAGDVLQGVQWIAALSPRTCLACLHRHGTIYPVGYVMESHPSCRCSLAPLARNTPPEVPETGEAWFARQPVAFQRERIGAAYGAYQDGRVTLADFTGVREHPIWGRSVQQRSATAVLKGVR